MSDDPDTPEARLRAFCDETDPRFADPLCDDLRAVLDRLARAEDALAAAHDAEERAWSAGVHFALTANEQQAGDGAALRGKEG